MAIFIGILIAIVVILIVTLGEELWLNFYDWLIRVGRGEDKFEGEH